MNNCRSGSHAAATADVVSAHLAPALAQGALVLSDLPREVPASARLPLPADARADRCCIVRRSRGERAGTRR